MGQQLGQQAGGWLVLWACKRKQRWGPNCVIRQMHKLDPLTSGSSSQPNIFSIKHLEWDSFLWVSMTQATSDKRKFTLCELKVIPVPNSTRHPPHHPFPSALLPGFMRRAFSAEPSFLVSICFAVHLNVFLSFLFVSLSKAEQCHVCKHTQSPSHWWEDLDSFPRCSLARQDSKIENSP